MARKAAGHIDLGKTYQLLNVILHKVTGGDIASPVDGQPQFRSDTGRFGIWSATLGAWVNKATDSDLLEGQNSAYHRSRANHTGTQLASTISDLQSYVDARIQLIVDSAPAALDTLNELAAALGDDANFAATVNAALTSLDGRLDSIEANGGPVKGYVTTIGDDSATSFVVTHNLGNQWPLVQVYDTASGDLFSDTFDYDGTSANTGTLTFGSVLANNGARVRIVG